ncbi:AAA family ATPase [Streptococcus mitis]|uniref:AAA family ATPase n=1 Tax=Streptococcus mitis TaxID=28037 RepID=UPI002283A3C7|nr:AAA family ATPase [Streptococcus mitis]MCY7169049.1 AAA family ATPase [Streptococcus mitis]
MTTYRVGTSFSSWSFGDAYSKAKDGDILALEEGYMLELPAGRHYKIEKSIKIVGKISETEGGGTLYHNTIAATLRIMNGVTVQFENIWFQVDDHRCALVIKGNSTVVLNTVYFNEQLDNKKVFIMVEGKSKLLIENAGNQLYNGSYSTTSIKVSNSTLELKRAELNIKLNADNGSSIQMEDTVIERWNSNILDIQDSSVTSINTVLKGGDAEQDYPAVFLSRSTAKLQNTEVIQPFYQAAVCLKNSASLESIGSSLTSIKAISSRVCIEQTTIRESLLLESNSFCRISDFVDIIGENEEKIDIYCGASVLIANTIKLNRNITPNIRLSENSYLIADTILKEFEDTNGIIWDISENSCKILNEESTNSEPQEEISEIIERDYEEELYSLIGLNNVKKEVQKLLRTVEFNQKRLSEGLPIQEQSLHSVFTGNPGTGKTTVARLLGRLLFDRGVLPVDEFKFIEVSESDLIATHIGETAVQTQAILEKAKGGILFIDEAYTLNKGKSSQHNFGLEAINTILKYMEDYRNEIMIIFAGYTKEMEQFFETNPGLKSRVPNTFFFEDYSGDEIVEMGLINLQKSAYQLEDESYYAMRVKQAYSRSLDHSNGRWIRNFNEHLMRALANRVVETQVEDYVTIINDDIDDVLLQGTQKPEENQKDALEQLQNLIGIQKVQKQVEQFISLAELNKKREEQGAAVSEFSLHSLFLGNPGTGKTTVARIVGKILYQKGIIPQNKFIEVSRSDLVAGYVGQTAIKTQEVLKSALGGVLFIDEAYTLSNSNEDRFGKEAIDEILKFMEDHRRDIVIIFAGYTKEMEEFLSVNSGLPSRIPNTFDFEDYTADEIIQIGLLGLKNQGYFIDVDYYTQTIESLYNKINDCSNGRWIRNINEKIIKNLSIRVSRENVTDLSTIDKVDIERMMLEYERL